MRYLSAALAIILLIATVAFAIQNRETVEVGLFFWSISLPKIILILGVYALGMVSGWGLVEFVKRWIESA